MRRGKLWTGQTSEFMGQDNIVLLWNMKMFLLPLLYNRCPRVTTSWLPGKASFWSPAHNQTGLWEAETAGWKKATFQMEACKMKVNILNILLTQTLWKEQKWLPFIYCCIPWQIIFCLFVFILAIWQFDCGYCISLTTGLKVVLCSKLGEYSILLSWE